MSFFSWCQIVRFIMLVSNCPGAKLSGAKLSVFIMLVPNCPGAKLSGANCPGAKLSGPKLSGAKLSYHPKICVGGTKFNFKDWAPGGL